MPYQSTSKTPYLYTRSIDIKYYHYMFFIYTIMHNENLTMIRVVSDTIDQNRFIYFTIYSDHDNSTN